MTRNRAGIALLISTVLLGVASRGQADDASAGPRLGKYKIFSYGTTYNAPLFLGSFTLSAGGKYQAFLPGDKSTGEGTYEFDPGKQAVIWKTGPYLNQWGGDFTIDREGKTHKIRLKRTTIATNSTD